MRTPEIMDETLVIPKGKGLEVKNRPLRIGILEIMDKAPSEAREKRRY